MVAAGSLEEAALLSVALSKQQEVEEVRELLKNREEENRELAVVEASKRKPGQKYVRGLFSGGTFCHEAQLLFKDLMTPLYSNAPAGDTRILENAHVSCENTVVDMGEDEFTTGRPHPMIDYSLRNRRILEEAKDPQTAVILLDVVLGYGSNMKPAEELAPVIQEARKTVLLVCSVTGTDSDPQNRSKVIESLKNAGAIVMQTNAAACRFAAHVVKFLNSGV